MQFEHTQQKLKHGFIDGQSVRCRGCYGRKLQLVRMVMLSCEKVDLVRWTESKQKLHQTPFILPPRSAHYPLFSAGRNPLMPEILAWMLSEMLGSVQDSLGISYKVSVNPHWLHGSIRMADSAVVCHDTLQMEISSPINTKHNHEDLIKDYLMYCSNTCFLFKIYRSFKISVWAIKD